MANDAPSPGSVPHLVKAIEHVSLLLEAVLAEQRFLRGMTQRDQKFIQSGESGANLYLEEFQERRLALFPSTER